MTLLCSCAPLRQTQTIRREQSETSDTILTQLIRREVESRFGTLRQTVVEFYPPTEAPQSLNLPDTLRAILPPPKIPVRQPIRRITYTEAAAQVDKTTSTDSISRSRINTSARNDTQVATEEKPSSSVAWLKWAAALALDPPYVGSDCGHYNGTFCEQDFERLLTILSEVKGKFMLTMFPHPLIEKFAAKKWLADPPSRPHDYRIQRLPPQARGVDCGKLLNFNFVTVWTKC